MKCTRVADRAFSNGEITGRNRVISVVRREVLASMETRQYRISLLFWLMTMVAVSVALAGINTQFLFLVVALWISMITVLICYRTLRMGFGLTSLVCVLVLDVCGASLCAFNSWVVESNPTAYPHSISLGDPPTAFLIGFLAFTPGAIVFSLVSTGIGWLTQNRSECAIIDEPSDARQALDRPF
jgi:hypothetical protein